MTTKSDDSNPENQPETQQPSSEEQAPAEATVAMQMTPELLAELERRAQAHDKAQGQAPQDSAESAAPAETAGDDDDDGDEATAMLQMTPELLAQLRENAAEPAEDVAPAVEPEAPAESVEAAVDDAEEATRMAEAMPEPAVVVHEEMGEEATMVADASQVAAVVQALDGTEATEAVAIPEPVAVAPPAPVAPAPAPVAPAPAPPVAPARVAAPSQGGGRGLMIGLLIGGAVLVLAGLLFVFLPMTDPFGLYGTVETDAGGAGADVPTTAQNAGESAGDLAMEHMPGGFDAYVGLSLSGVLDSALVSPSETKMLKKQLSRSAGPLKGLLKEADLGVDSISTAVVGLGERGAYGAAQFGEDVDIEEVDGVLSDVDGVSVKNWGEVEQVYLNSRAKMAAFTQDDGVLVMGHSDTVKNVLDGDDDEYPGSFSQEESIETLMSHLNLNGVAWAMAAPEGGIENLPQVPTDEIPAPLRTAVLDGLMAVGVAVHLNEDIFVQVALMYEDSDRAEEVLDALSELKEEHLSKNGLLQIALDESEEGSADEEAIQIVHAHLYASQLDISGEVVTFNTRVREDLIDAVRTKMKTDR